MITVTQWNRNQDNVLIFDFLLNIQSSMIFAYLKQ